MKYRQLPLERELADMSDNDRNRLVAGLMLETMSTRGFQLVTGVLRNLERAYDLSLRGNVGIPDRAIGALQAIESIRRSLIALLAVDQRANVDWFDDVDEGFVTVDQKATADPDI